MADMDSPFQPHEVPGTKSAAVATVSVSKPIAGAHSGWCDHRTWSRQSSAGVGRLFSAVLLRWN